MYAWRTVTYREEVNSSIREHCEYMETPVYLRGSYKNIPLKIYNKNIF
jgi:hypothetical protein